jgi:hypothetical protein
MGSFLNRVRRPALPASTVSGWLACHNPVQKNGPPLQLNLIRLLPRFPRLERPLTPLIHFRTLDGYRFWPVALGGDCSEEMDPLRIRRAFEILAPSGERRHCAVDIGASVQAAIADLTHREFPPEHRMWDVLSKSAVSHHLRARAELPPDQLQLRSLSREQHALVQAVIRVHSKF